MNRPITTSGGFTLTETLTALVVFMTVAAGLAGSTIAIIRGNAMSRRTAAAASLAQAKIEEFRSITSAADSPQLGPGTHEDPENPITALGETGGVFMRSWTVTNSAPDEGLAMVEVKVTWEEPQPGSVESVALVCENSSCM